MGPEIDLEKLEKEEKEKLKNIPLKTQLKQQKKYYEDEIKRIRKHEVERLQADLDGDRIHLARARKRIAELEKANKELVAELERERAATHAVEEKCELLERKVKKLTDDLEAVILF